LKIFVLHGSVATQLKHGGIYNNQIIANCLCHVFYGPRCRWWLRLCQLLCLGQHV